MATKQIPWNTGDGAITLTYTGQGNGTVTVSSDENFGEARQQSIIVRTTDNKVSRTVTVKQAATALNFRTADGMFIKTADEKYFNVKET